MSTTKKCEHCGRELRLQTYESAQWWVDASIHRHSCEAAKDARIAELETQLAELARVGHRLIDADERGQGLPWQEAMKDLEKMLATLDGAAGGEASADEKGGGC